jgi:hypothetical protein
MSPDTGEAAASYGRGTSLTKRRASLSTRGRTYRPLQRQRGAGSHWPESISNRPDHSNHFGWLVLFLFSTSLASKTHFSHTQCPPKSAIVPKCQSAIDV